MEGLGACLATFQNSTMIDVFMVCVLSAMYIHGSQNLLIMNNWDPLYGNVFCPMGTSYLSSNNQTWKILGMIFYVYLKEYTAKIRDFKKSVSRYQTHQYIICQGIELSESDKESTGKASIEKMWRSSHQRSI